MTGRRRGGADGGGTDLPQRTQRAQNDAVRLEGIMRVALNSATWPSLNVSWSRTSHRSSTVHYLSADQPDEVLSDAHLLIVACRIHPGPSASSAVDLFLRG